MTVRSRDISDSNIIHGQQPDSAIGRNKSRCCIHRDRTVSRFDNQRACIANLKIDICQQPDRIVGHHRQMPTGRRNVGRDLNITTCTIRHQQNIIAACRDRPIDVNISIDRGDNDETRVRGEACTGPDIDRSS